MSDLRPALMPSAAEACPPSAHYAGKEWIVEAYECDAAALKELSTVVGLCRDVIVELGLKVIGDPLAHAFPGPGGVTAMFMLSESHLACHTYPEFRLATFNLYCCAERRSWPWESELRSRLAARRVSVRSVARGVLAGGAM